MTCRVARAVVSTRRPCADAGLRFLSRERGWDETAARRTGGRRGAAATEARIERELAAVLGSASARVLLDARAAKPGISTP
jgi:hypothetical protein